MQLEDPQGEGVVSLFIRLMRLRTKINPYSGVPGGLLISDDPPDRDLLVLIHELEHVTALTRPLGFLLNALGVRLLDAHNACTKLLKEMIDGRAASESQCENLVKDLATWQRCGDCTLTLAAVALPLLEGLALYAEGTLEVTGMSEGLGSFDLAVALEYQHLLSLAQGRVAPFQQDDLTVIYSDLWAMMIRRLATARERNAGYDATQALFFGPGKNARGRETAQYFLGYLYVVRLLQTWRSTTGGRISDQLLIFAANRFAGQVLALFTAMHFELAMRLKNNSDFLEKLIALLLKALDFTAGEIEMLIHTKGILMWDDGLTIPETGTADTSAVLARSIVVYVFGEEEAARPDATWDALVALEPARNLQLASVQPVSIAGHGPEQDAFRLRLPGAVDRFIDFPVKPELMPRFLALLAERGMTVGPTGAAPRRDRAPMAPVSGQVQTWLELWPGGIDPDRTDVGYYLGLVKIRRMLQASDMAILDRDTPEDRTRSLVIRSSLLQNLDGVVQETIGNDWAALRTVAEYAKPFFMDKHSLLKVMRQFWEEYQDPAPDIQARCHAYYTLLLFPGVSAGKRDMIPVEKLGPLFTELEADGAEGKAAAKALWRFLKTAVWRPPVIAGAGQAPVAATAELDLIRAASLRILGIPLVRMTALGLEFDLIPPGDSLA